MIRLHRLLSTFVLSLLLVGMQLGSELHALDHFGEALKHTPDHSWTAAGDDVCPICTLFAGGTNAAAGDADVAGPVAVVVPHACSTPESIATPAPSYYSSRAPPSLL